VITSARKSMWRLMAAVTELTVHARGEIALRGVHHVSAIPMK
jgi:hypothetical protein